MQCVITEEPDEVLPAGADGAQVRPQGSTSTENAGLGPVSSALLLISPFFFWGTSMCAMKVGREADSQHCHITHRQHLMHKYTSAFNASNQSCAAKGCLQLEPTACTEEGSSNAESAPAHARHGAQDECAAIL